VLADSALQVAAFSGRYVVVGRLVPEPAELGLDELDPLGLGLDFGREEL